MVDFAYRNQHSFLCKWQKPNSSWLSLKEICSVTERPLASGMAGSRNSNNMRTKLILSPFHSAFLFQASIPWQDAPSPCDSKAASSSSRYATYLLATLSDFSPQQFNNMIDLIHIEIKWNGFIYIELIIIMTGDYFVSTKRLWLMTEARFPIPHYVKRFIIIRIMVVV